MMHTRKQLSDDARGCSPDHQTASYVYVATLVLVAIIRSTQPCIPPGSFNRVPASAGVRAGMSPLPGGR